MGDDFYTPIADRAVAILGEPDPARYLEAYEAMRAERETVALQSVRRSRKALVAALGVATATRVLERIDTALDADGDLSAYAKGVVRALVESEDGVDLAHPEPRALLAKWRDTPGMAFAAEDYDALDALTREQAETWPGLLPGEVQNALEKRQWGDA